MVHGTATKGNKMGFGDAVMASATARTVYERTGMKTAFGDGVKVRWGRPEEEVFEHNPHVIAPNTTAMQKKEFIWAANYSGFRPYVDRDRMVKEFHAKYPMVSVPGTR